MRTSTMRDRYGRVDLPLRPPGARPRRVRQWVSKREDRWVYRSGDRWVMAYWRPFVGLHPVACGSFSTGRQDREWENWWKCAMPIRRPAAGGPINRAALPNESTALKKYPTLCEWLSATTYEDGSPRVPGYFWFTNRCIAFEVTLFDPDQCVKMPCLGRTIDEALACAETHLRAEDAPWQPDPYLAERKANQGAKKRK